MAASTTPAVFSTALPAIATITSPANSSDTPTWSIVGRSAAMNQSDTNAAPDAASASSTTAARQPEAAARVLLGRRAPPPRR